MMHWSSKDNYRPGFMMKKILILASIASTVCTTHGSSIPPGAVECGAGRYRFDPYDIYFLVLF